MGGQVPYVSQSVGMTAGDTQQVGTDLTNAAALSLRNGPYSSATLYPAAQLVMGYANTADVENHNIGGVFTHVGTFTTNGSTPLTGWGVGAYGKGWTNGGTRSAGVVGEGMVVASTDTGAAVGLRGYAKQTHADGLNIGVYGDATGSSVGNSDFYGVNGTINSATGTLTTYGNLAATGNFTVGSGATGLVVQPRFGGAPFATIYSTNIGTQTNVNYSLLTDGTITFLNGSTSSSLNVGGSAVAVITATGAAVTGTLSSTATIRTGGYTVATLPVGVSGDRAHVTDALAPAFGAAVAGGGAVVIPVIKNATVWVVG